MNINQLHQNNLVSQINQNGNSKVLKNGSQVLVRIINSNGNNKYTAIVSGVKVQVTAKNPLSPGQVFVANANSKDGKILITPNKETVLQNILEVIEGRNLSEKIDDVTAFVKNPQISNLLQSLGLVPNNLSLSILLQMKQLGLKFESSVMLKIYNQALKFIGKEKKAAEIMILLQQKGMNFTEDDIQAILSQLEQNDFLEEKNSDGKSYEKKSELSVDKSILRNFINQIIQSSNEKIGVLTILNHLGWKKNGSGNGSWIILPFEIKDLKNDDCIGNGNLKIYFDQMKKFRKIHLSCDYFEKLYNIVFEESEFNINIKLNITNEKLNEGEICQKLKGFIKSKKNINIEFVEKEMIENLGAGLENVVMLGGDV